jgi:hypothetical protein
LIVVNLVTDVAIESFRMSRALNFNGPHIRHCPEILSYQLIYSGSGCQNLLTLNCNAQKQ